MNFFEELFENKEEPLKKVEVKKEYKENLEIIKEYIGGSGDVIFREFTVGNEKIKCSAIYTEGLANQDLVSEHILKNLMLLSRTADIKTHTIKQKICELLKNMTISATDVSETEDINKAVDVILSGDTVLILENYDKLLVIASKGWPMRGVGEPSTETVVRGPRDGFTETMRINTALVRRRIRDPKFKVKQMKVGRRSKTDIAIMFIEEIVNKDVLKMVKERLDKIDIDMILESGYIEQLIEDDWKSPFPQMQHTQRPDVVAAGIYEGRVAIVVDNTPFVLLAPSTAVTFLQSPEDYSERFFIGSALRILRFIAIIMSLTMPALYIAITSYHPGMLPTDLALYIAGSRMNVPFPSFIEAFIMEAAFELLREAGVRLPGAMGATIGIVGGLVLGQAAVEAGIVSPLMVIVVALTAIASAVTPNYSLAIAFRILRFALMISAGVFGLYGIILGIIVIMIHLCNLKSFGVSYLSPIVASSTTPKDFKDVFIRAPIQMMKTRPQYLHRRDSSRQRDKERGDGNGEE